MDVAVQTESVMAGGASPPYGQTRMDTSEDEELSKLSVSDLVSILNWSKEISSDINLSSGALSVLNYAHNTNTY